MLGRIGVLWRVRRTIGLAWRLLRDRRTPITAKLIPLLGVLYVLFPVDLVPDFFPALGQLDDFTVIILAILLFIRSCPSQLVSEHLEGESRNGSEKRGKGPVIDGDYEVLE